MQCITPDGQRSWRDTPATWARGHPDTWHLRYLSVSDSGQMVAWRGITHADKRVLADTYSLAYSCLTQIIHGEPDALQIYSLKHTHANRHCSRSSYVLCSWEGERVLHFISDITLLISLYITLNFSSKTIKVSWEIVFSYLLALCLCHCQLNILRLLKDYTIYMMYVGPGLRFKPRGLKHMWPTRIWLWSTHLLADRLEERKILGTLFLCEQRQRSGSRFWIRRMTKRQKKKSEMQTQKDTMKPSAPQKILQRQWVKQKQAQRDKQSNESLENFKKRWHISFICSENACLSKQGIIQC